MPKFLFILLGSLGSLLLAGGGFLPLHQLVNGRTISLYTSSEDLYSWLPLCGAICLVSILLKGYIGAIAGSLLSLFTLNERIFSYWHEIGKFGPGSLVIGLGFFLSFASAVILNFHEFPLSSEGKSDSNKVPTGVKEQLFQYHIPLVTSVFIVVGCSLFLFVIILFLRGKIAIY